MIIHIVRPSKIMAMHRSFALLVISRIGQNAGEFKFSRSTATPDINKARIGIIGHVFVHTVLIVRLGTVSVVIIRPAILGPAAHGSVRGTRG